MASAKYVFENKSLRLVWEAKFVIEVYFFFLYDLIKVSKHMPIRKYLHQHSFKLIMP